MIAWWRKLRAARELQRRPFSIAIYGTQSGNTYPPLKFLRFRTAPEADRWIVRRELSSKVGDERDRMTQWVVVDLRLPE